MLIDSAAFPGRTATVVLLLVAAAILGVAYVRCRRTAPPGTYVPPLAWLRAGLYFCACLLVASFSGALGTVLQAPLASAAQLAQGGWWALTLAYAAVIVIGYGVIWPKGTFTDGRVLHPVLTLAYGSVWGACQGLWFLSIWAGVEWTGLGQPWLAVTCYVLIGGYNGLWHRFFWDLHVSPPHNVTEWNGRKVGLCHTPNLLLGVTHLALFGNAAVFVLMQVVALALSARAMHFPSFRDDYRAVPGQERSFKGPAA